MVLDYNIESLSKRLLVYQCGTLLCIIFTFVLLLSDRKNKSKMYFGPETYGSLI